MMGRCGHGPLPPGHHWRNFTASQPHSAWITNRHPEGDGAGSIKFYREERVAALDGKSSTSGSHRSALWPGKDGHHGYKDFKVRYAREGGCSWWLA